MPHMHLRGKDFEYEAVYPDGETEILLTVPRYDFNWQLHYAWRAADAAARARASSARRTSTTRRTTRQSRSRRRKSAGATRPGKR